MLTPPLAAPLAWHAARRLARAVWAPHLRYAGDFFLPGSPWEAWAITYNGKTHYNYMTNNVRSGRLMVASMMDGRPGEDGPL